MSFTLPSLPYDYKDLEPHIDAKTMEIHHTKHHQAYVNNLNKALEGNSLKEKSLEEILSSKEGFENTAIRNNAGGHYNHRLFWEILTPKQSHKQPQGELATQINQVFGSFEKFKEEFTSSATKRFGSGWAWLYILKDKKLKISSTANQDNPLMPIEKSGIPILGLDVWEHAYYLKYQNKRPEYIEAFWNVINWEKVESLYLANK